MKSMIEKIKINMLNKMTIIALIFVFFTIKKAKAISIIVNKKDIRPIWKQSIVSSPRRPFGNNVTKEKIAIRINAM